MFNEDVKEAIQHHFAIIDAKSAYEAWKANAEQSRDPLVQAGVRLHLDGVMKFSLFYLDRLPEDELKAIAHVEMLRDEEVMRVATERSTQTVHKRSYDFSWF